MGRLNHEPEAYKEDASNNATKFPTYEEGEYFYRIDNAYDHTFNSGNTGIRLELSCWQETEFGGLGDVLNVQESIVIPKVNWKLEQVCESVGVDFDNPDLGTEDLIQKESKCYLHRQVDRKTKEKSRYLSVKKFHPLEEQMPF